MSSAENLEKLISSISDSVTLELMTDPYVIPACQHTFEKSVLEDIAAREQANAKCPTCRQPFTVGEIQPNYSMRDVIASTTPLIEKLRNDIQLEEMTQAAKQLQVVDDEKKLAAADAKAAPPSATEAAATVTKSADGKYTMVEITSPTGGSRIGTDLCLCLDNSGSMCSEVFRQGEDGKQISDGLTIMDICKHAAKTVVAAASGTDRISIVTFSSTSEILLPLTVMDAKGKAEANRVLSTIEPTNATNLWGGVQASFDVIRAAYAGRNSSVCLLTDGVPSAHLAPTRGYMGSLKRYREQYPDFICSLNMIGFGYSLDSALLDEMSHTCDGAFLFVPDAGMVGTIFIHLMSNILTTFGTGLQLKLELNDTAHRQQVLDQDFVTQCFDVTEIGDGVSLSLNNITLGQNRSVVFEGDLDISAVSLSYTNTSSCAPQRFVFDDIKATAADTNVLMAQLFRQLLVSNVRQGMNKYKRDQNGAQAAVNAMIDGMEGMKARGAEAKAVLQDATGQVSEAFSRKDWFDKWGRHYLPSLLRAHTYMQCNNFKDPGLQMLGGKLFKTLKDEIDEKFNSLPPPTPTIKKQPVRRASPSYGSKSISLSRSRSRTPPRAAPLNMRSYNNFRGGCFRGDGRVAMADGSYKRVDQVCRGDRLAAYNGSYVQALASRTGYEVEAVVRTQCFGSEAMFCQLGGLVLTPWHPVLASAQPGVGQPTWRFPADLAPSAFTEPCHFVYNFLLEQGHIATIEGTPCVTLGHSFDDNACIQHPYFGSQQVVHDVRALPGYANGLVDVQESSQTRHAVTGLVTSL